MYYFAYGSNMSCSRLKQRVPSADAIGCFALSNHDLRFHKSSKDGSGKCDAYYTSDSTDVLYGVLFKIDPREKSVLDRVEGLGYGYDTKKITVTAHDGRSETATTYVATKIDKSLKPYSWYVNHVFVGAKEASLPSDYIDSKIVSVDTMKDPDKERDAKERDIYS